MIRQNLKVAVKNAIKNKRITIINTLGLALGLACAIMIYLWVEDELSYEKNYKNADQIHLAYLKVTSGSNVSYQPTTSPVISKRISDIFPEVQETARILSLGETTLKFNNNIFNETNGVAADPSVFSIFNFEVLNGYREQALESPQSVVLTESMAKKYFGNNNPVGEFLQVNNTMNFKVTAVINDFPKNAYRRFDFMVPVNSLTQFGITPEGTDFFPCNYLNYIKLKKDADLLALNKKIEENISGENESARFDIELIPITKTYLQDSGGAGRLIVFSIISIFVLFLACINYTNLTIGTLINRVREINIRRTIGAFKKQLVAQLVTESILISFFALIVALILTVLFLNQFNTLTNKQIEINFSESGFIVLIILLPLITGVVSGLLPGLKFAGIKTGNSRNGSVKTSLGIFRKGLVVFQFIITVVFIVSTLVIQRQSSFISNYNVGFNKDNVYYVRLNEVTNTKITEIKQILQQDSRITKIASSSVLPNNISSGNFFPWGTAEVTAKRICEIRVDYDFLDLFNMKLTGGRFFDESFPSDTEQSILISETAFNQLNDENAIGKQFTYGGNQIFNLIGVVKDFQNNSALASRPDAISYILSPNENRYLFFKINSNVNDPLLIDKTIQNIHKVCDSFSPNRPLYYSYLNDFSYAIESQFDARAKLIFLATLLTILISVFGLFGLVYISVKNKVKEIGIRKVNGASVFEVTGLISFDYLKLIGISFVVAFPLAYLGMDQVLKLFANRIALSWWIFALAGALALGIALITVSFQSWKAATRNPVEALRYE
ncbi:MAG: ABC transporter permease [Prolixibacteraceae bacterium]|nr:ABC transporter permease [Prolixibacteraceae bacterium]